MSGRATSLRTSAQEGLIWGVAFTFGRDVIQFLSMLVLVRLLSPEIYGQFALAQAIQLFLAVVSVKSIAPFALQARDPNAFDWDTQFTAGAALNISIFILVLIVSVGIYFFGPDTGRIVAIVLAFMGLTFLIEIIGTHYSTWLQAHHSWKQMRLLLFAGTLIGSLVAIVSAALGAGVFALAVGNLCFALPLTVDYFIRKPFPFRFQPSRLRLYQEGRKFAANRIMAGSLVTGSNLAEHSILSGIFGFATLGIYTRSIGLAQITSGRIGPIVTQTLYPVLTRAEASSERFRRFAGILIQGVLWTSAPAALFLGLEANNLVRLLYGEKWLEVIPLMGVASTLLALRGLHITMNQIMLANLQQRACLRLDLAAAISMMIVIFATVYLGPFIYLCALGAHAALIVVGTGYVATRGGAINSRALIRHVVACVGALTIAWLAVILVLPSFNAGDVGSIIAEIVIRGIVFSTVYIIALKLFAPRDMAVLLHALPLPQRVLMIIAPSVSNAREKA